MICEVANGCLIGCGRWPYSECSCDCPEGLGSAANSKGVLKGKIRDVWDAERRGVKFEQIYIEGVRSRVLGASEGHTSRVACRAIGPQGVCGASTWSHTMLETSGTGPSDQGSLETTIPVTGPFTPGSGFRQRHGTTTSLAQQWGPSASRTTTCLAQQRGP